MTPEKVQSRAGGPTGGRDFALRKNGGVKWHHTGNSRCENGWLIGPDAVGKSSLLSLLAGSRAVQEGTVEALGGDMASGRHRESVCPHIAYMPQGLGKNLYPTLSVEENLQFFGRLFGHDAAERRRRIDEFAAARALRPFLTRRWANCPAA